MIDRSGQGSGEPAQGAFVISPSDLQYLPFLPRAIYVGTGGNVALMTVTGDIVIFVGVATGSVLAVRAVKIFATNTTATNLVGMY